VNNNEMHHLYVGTTQGNVLKTVKQHRLGGKSHEVWWRGFTLTQAECTYRHALKDKNERRR
jgi:hypothetical protein